MAAERLDDLTSAPLAQDQDSVLCPSSSAQPGAILLGIIMPDGRVAYAADRIMVDEEFIGIARQGRTPEKRFRFSHRCVKNGCAQWSGTACGVIERLLDQWSVLPEEDLDLPDCSIRAQCRWYRQRGGMACRVCPEVITDSRIDVEELPQLCAVETPLS